MPENEHGFLNGLRRVVDQAAIATGLAVEVPVEHREESPSDHPPATTIRQPTVPGAVVSLPRAVDSSAADVMAQFQVHFPSVLQAMPPAFQNFLAQKEELMESLRDSVNADKLEEAATKAALRVTKITPQDVKEAMETAHAALQRLRADIAVSLAKEQTEGIRIPTQKLAQSRSEIGQIDHDIADLQRRKEALEAGITPHEQAIIAAEENLAYTTSVYGSCCTKIEEVLGAMQQQLTKNREGVKR